MIFDVGGVLIDNPWPGMLEHYSEHLDIEKEAFMKAYSIVLDEWQRGLITEKPFWKKMCGILQRNMPRSESLWMDGFKKVYKEKEEIFSIIGELKRKGYKIGLLSNTEIPVMKFLIERKYPHFDAFIYSCGLNLAKPDTRIYEEMARKLGVKPFESVFIDDKQENIEGAENAGMKGVLFTGSKQIESYLQNLLK